MKRLFIILTLILIPAICAAATITPVSIRAIDSTRQVVNFTVTIDGQKYMWHGNTPTLTGADLQKYLDSQKDKIELLILNRLYPNADCSGAKGETKLEQMQAWITSGHTNPDEVVIEKVTWVPTWSEEKVQIDTDLKDSPFYGKTKVERDKYIDTEWEKGNQKALFKALLDKLSLIEQKSE